VLILVACSGSGSGGFQLQLLFFEVGLLILGAHGSEELKPLGLGLGPAVEAGVVIHVTVSCTLASARPSGVDGVHSGRAEGMHRINLPACRPARDCMVHGV
jgi:hypothetical protein